MIYNKSKIIIEDFHIEPCLLDIDDHSRFYMIKYFMLAEVALEKSQNNNDNNVWTCRALVSPREGGHGTYSRIIAS